LKNESRVIAHGGAAAPSRSAELYSRALRVMPGGCSRNAVIRKPHPFYAARGEGCFVWDVEGVRRLDFSNNMGSQVLGHCPAAVQRAVAEQLRHGTAFTMGTEAEILLAEHMCGRVAGFDKIRFVNSGTEAVMCAIKAARAFTGRSKIAKVEGAYHGLYDYAEVSQTAGPATWGPDDSPSSVPVAQGTPPSALTDVIVIPFNDSERAVAVLDRHAGQLACVLIDLVPHRVGLMPASGEYVSALAAWAQRNGALIVCDEVITFRTHYGGAQQGYAARPDITALGKMIGGGFPVGAVGGREDIMSVFNPLADPVRVPHSGTFSANPITMVAGRAAMEEFDAAAVERLNRLGERARAQLREAIAVAGVPACITGAGSMFRIHMKGEAPENYRAAFAGKEEAARRELLLGHLLECGILLIATGTGMLSTPMGGDEIDELSGAMLEALRKVRPLLR
jgi:glutamate-1-semialdehyde 2,1-aminomutase